MKLIKILQHDGYQRALARMVYNEEVDEELHQPVIKEFQKWRVYAKFKDKIWTPDLDQMRSLSSKNQNVKCLLCVIDVFTKYAWVKALKDNESKTVLHAFIKIVNKSNHKPNKLWGWSRMRISQ